MRSGWAAWMLLAALALGLRWLATAAADARSGRRGSTSASDPAIAGPWDADASSPLFSPATVRAREPEALSASRAAELARAHWVEGRVDLPAGLPADEACFVVADGRKFSDGTIHRARVGLDGRFRVAFSPEAKAGWIGLEARYLDLPRRARWVLSRPQEELTLAPELGGVVTGRLVVPPSARGKSPDGEIELRGTGIESCGRLTAPLRGGEYTFEQVPCGTALEIRYRGSSWLARSAPFGLAPGETEQLELACVPGVVLAGKVRDERGRGIEG